MLRKIKLLVAFIVVATGVLVLGQGCGKSSTSANPTIYGATS